MNESGIFHKNDFSDLTFTRIIRFSFVAIITLFLIANIFGIGIASAEIGSVIVESESSYGTEPTSGAAGGATNFTQLQFDVANWNYIEEYYISFTNPNDVFLLQANSTFFTCVSPNVCNGVVSYNRLGNILLWDFATGSDITASPISMIYEVNIFDAYNIGQASQVYATESVGGNIPVCLLNTYSATRCAYGVSGSVPTRYISATNSTVGFSTSLEYNITYPLAGKFSGSIDKEGAIHNKVTLVNDVEEAYYAESDFTDTDFVLPLLTYGNGLWINVSLASGAHTLQLINASGATTGVPVVTATPTIDPVTHAGILWNKNNYTVYEIGTLAYSYDVSFWDAIYTHWIELSYNDELLTPKYEGLGYSGSISYQFINAGSYTAKYYKCLIFPCIIPELLDTKTVSVSLGLPDSIYLNSTYYAYIASNISYYKNPYNENTEFSFWYWSEDLQKYIYSSTSFGTPSGYGNKSFICGISTTYKITFGDAVGYTQCKVSTTQAPFNITSSFINVDTPTPQFTEYLEVSYGVSSDAWVNNETYINVYDAAGIKIYSYQVVKQYDNISFFIVNSPHTFRDMVMKTGTNTIKLENINEILDYETVTVSEVSEAGYGLIMDKDTYCSNEKITYKYYSPAPINITLWDADTDTFIEKGYLNTSISGKRTFFLYSKIGTYDVRLMWGGIQYANAMIKIENCQVVPTQTPLSGAGQALQIAGLLTSSIFWSLIITAGLMIAIAWKTKDGFPTGTIGMLSGGVFSFLGWLPIWIFFSVLIIGSLFIAESIVSKQLSKMG